MTEDIFTKDDWQFAEESPTLGPHYAMARRVVEDAMKGFQDDMLKPILEEAAKEFQDKLWDKVHDTIWLDTEYNLQGHMWRAVDRIVESLLGGNEWAIRQYVTDPNKYDSEKIRRTIAALIPEELQSAALKDAQAKIEKLEKDLEFARRSY